MATYILSHPSVKAQATAYYQYPPPFFWHIRDELPHPTRDYTVVLTEGWQDNPIAHLTSIAEFLQRARLVDCSDLFDLRHIYEGKNILLCEHVSRGIQVSIMRAESGYLFLCPLCIAVYAINGIPDLPETLFQALSPQLLSDFPEPPKGKK